MTMKTAQLCDLAGERARVCVGPWRSFGARGAFSGRVCTIKTFEDAALIRTRLCMPGQGRVLVVDAGGSLRVAVLGDQMARIGAQSGWSGILVHGAVRDVDELAHIELGVCALGSVPARGSKSGVGACDVALSIRGVQVKPGDFMAIDADGVVFTDEPPTAA